MKNERKTMYISDIFLEECFRVGQCANSCHRRTNLSNYNLRNAHINLSVPKPRTNYLKKSFGCSGAVLWNSLPTQAKQTESLSSFKNLIK